jgi:3-oxoacyl-[acyl-carrier protein] reductase
MPLPPRKSSYAIGIAQNTEDKRLIVSIDRKFFGKLKIGMGGKVETQVSMDSPINYFLPNLAKEKSRAKVALVTGSTSGIGQAIALKLAQEGFDIVINSAGGQKEGKDMVRQIKEIGRSAIYVEADVSQESAVDQMIAKTIKKFGKIDILVNNAGITRDKKLENMTKEDWDLVIAVNLTGVFNCTKSAISHMQEEGSGKIINISSVVGEMGNFGQANYSASKGGIIAFTKTVAKENAGDNITVNAIAPGFIKTKMVEAIPKSIIKGVIGQIPMGRLGESEEVADLVAFLSSDKANYITGQIFNINGGLYM